MKINLFQLQKYPWGKEVIQRKNRIERKKSYSQDKIISIL